MHMSRAIVLAFLGLQIVACSSPHGAAVTFPRERHASFVTIGNGGCTNPEGGCPVGWLCWDGSEPDPVFGSCPIAPPGPPGARPTPVPGCDLSAATVAVTPLNRVRTTLGVGEQVDLSSNGTWAVSGDGSLDTTGSDVRFTAGATPGVATVTASGRNCSAASIAYTIIQPTGLSYVALPGVRHTMGHSDVGMKMDFYLLPDSVSFVNRQFLESNDTTTVSSGPWACGNGNHGHGANPDPVPVGDEVLGLGSVVGTDEAYVGSCYGLNQLAAGSDTFAIPDIYLGSNSAQITFTTTAQTARADGTGNLSMSKGSAMRTTTVNSPTSSY